MDKSKKVMKTINLKYQLQRGMINLRVRDG